MSNEYEDRVNVHQSGGLTRVSWGTPDTGAIPQQPGQDNSIRVGTGALRWTPDGGVASQGVTRVDCGAGPVDPSAGIMASARNAAGSMRLDRTTTVDVGGIRTDLDTAERMGYIRKVGPGIYEDARTVGGAPASGNGGNGRGNPSEGTAPSAGGDRGDPPQGDPGADYFDAAADADWAADIAPLQQHAFDSALASGTGAIVSGEGSLEDTAMALARNAGIEPALASEYVQAGAAHYQKAADRAMAAEGLTGSRLEEAYEYMRSAVNKGPLQDAIQNLLHKRDVSGFRALAREFKAKNPGDLSHLHAAGFETHVDPRTGDVLVKLPGRDWARARDL